MTTNKRPRTRIRTRAQRLRQFIKGYKGRFRAIMTTVFNDIEDSNTSYSMSFDKEEVVYIDIAQDLLYTNDEIRYMLAN